MITRYETLVRVGKLGKPPQEVQSLVTRAYTAKVASMEEQVGWGQIGKGAMPAVCVAHG